MKYLATTMFALFICTISTFAQYESTTYLYDTISEGPLLAPEKGGYNFIFKTNEIGTMVSTRGQVINPAMPYQMFNHYHIQASGEVDSIFSIPIRSEVNHHYTMYQRGAPKLIQFRVGTSNDYGIETIESKYPILSSSYNNDENLSISKIDIEQEKYLYSTSTYKKGVVQKKDVKNEIDLTAEEGKWVQKGHVTSSNENQPLSIAVFGKLIENDKERKFNELFEYKFITLDKAGNAKFDEEIIFERAYEFAVSGNVHSEEGNHEGFYVTFREASGKANKDYNSSARKVVFFDEKGQYLSETKLNLPFEPKSKDVENNYTVKVMKVGSEHRVIFYTVGSKKEKIVEGFYTFADIGETAEEIAFNPLSELVVEQDMRNQQQETTKEFMPFKYTQKLLNGDVLCVASENGTFVDFLQFDKHGKLKFSSTGYLLNDEQNQKAKLSFEQLTNNKILIISKIGADKSVKTSYAIYDGVNGNLRTIQPEATLQNFKSYRNGNDILVFGSDVEDVNLLHFKLEKLVKKDEGLTTLGRE